MLSLLGEGSFDFRETFFFFCICSIFYSKDRRKVKIMLQFKEGKVKQDGGGGVGSLYFSYTGIWLLPKKPYSVKKERKNFTFHVNFW